MEGNKDVIKYSVSVLRIKINKASLSQKLDRLHEVTVIGK